MRIKHILIGILLGVLLSSAVAALAGDPDNPPGLPASTSSYTLDDIYHGLTDGTAATPSTFTEPSSGPDTGTMHTLDEIYAAIGPPAAVPRTGQTTSYATGDDGDLEMGVAWPSSRFTDNNDGTVTDNLTGLIWLKNANCFGTQTWANALSSANTLNSGECGLTDGSVEGDWRLPNVREQTSLADYSRFGPPLPSGHPFTGVQSTGFYWTSTTYSGNTSNAWAQFAGDGMTSADLKTDTNYVWPVRGGE